MEIYKWLSDGSWQQPVLFWGTVVFLWLTAIQYACWIFAVGRFGQFANRPVGTISLRYLFADGLVKLINDFRHLLALILVLVFASLVLMASFKSKSPAELKDAIEAVVAPFGSIIGAIIGYYFGESAGKRAALNPDGTSNGFTSFTAPPSAPPPSQSRSTRSPSPPDDPGELTPAPSVPATAVRDEVGGEDPNQT